MQPPPAPQPSGGGPHRPAAVPAPGPAGPAPDLLRSARVVVDGSLPDRLLDGIAAATGVRVDRSAASGAGDVPLVRVGPVLPDTQRGDARLVWFHSSNAGVDALLGPGSWPREVLLTRTVGRMGERMAQYVLGWILAGSQSVPGFLDQHRERVWNRLPGELVAGGRGVVVGTGEIGSAVGSLLRRVGIHTVGISRTPRARAGFDEVLPVEQLHLALRQARWVVSALPLTQATEGFFDADLLGQFEGSMFVNVGRGATVDLDALAAALASGRVSSAVLDVLAEEPPGQDAQCWRLPRTTVTSHSAGVTTPEDVLGDFTACWHALTAGATPRLVVRPEQGY